MSENAAPFEGFAGSRCAQTDAERAALVGATAEPAGPPRSDEPDKADRPEDNRSSATLLVRLAESRYTFGSAADGEPFAVLRAGAFVARMLRGGRDSIRAELAAAYFDLYGRAASSSALADALGVIEGRAIRVERTDVALRLARFGDAIVLDLGDATGRVVVVEPGAWRVTARSPVLFRRTALTVALPEPVAGASLAELRALLNVSDETFEILVAWLVAALVPDLPHPILFLTGEHGTAKSTAARLLGRAIDPSAAPLRMAPRDVEAWAIQAAGSWIVPLDNVSRISADLSDALCRAATGDGLVRRRLYSDSELSVLSFRRVPIVTSIDAGALRGDLADRLLAVELERIPDSARRSEAEIERLFAAAHPRLLGALLTVLADVLTVLPSVRLDAAPRMADFARVVAAVDIARATSALATYCGNRETLAEDVVDGDAVAAAVRDFVDRMGEWRGTASELLAELRADPMPRDWPTTGKTLGARLKRFAPTLRAVGVEIERDRDPGRKRTRYLVLRKVARASSSAPSVLSDAPPPEPGRVPRTADNRADETGATTAESVRVEGGRERGGSGADESDKTDDDCAGTLRDVA